MELKHTYDINHLYDIIKKNEINFESQINQIKEKYNALNDELWNDIRIKGNKNTELTKESVELNRILNTISCRALTKSIIDFLYHPFTSLFKGNIYFEEKNTIIKKIFIEFNLVNFQILFILKYNFICR